MASRPRITAARVLAGIACAMLLPSRLAGVGARPSSAPPLEPRRHPHCAPRRGPGRGHRPLPSPHRANARAHVAHAAGVRLSHWLGTPGLWLGHVRPGHTDEARDLGARALRRCPLGRAKPLRVAQRHDAGRPALRPGLGPPQHRPDRPEPHRDGRRRHRRPRGVGSDDRLEQRGRRRRRHRRRLLAPATWPRTSGRTPARPAAARSRTGSTTTGTATSTTGTAGTSASTPTTRWTRSATARTSRARSAPPATTAPAWPA